MSKINNDWKEILEEEFQKDYFVELKNILEKEYENYTVYPPKKDILNAFFLTPYSEVKVVLLGQDPYHQKGQAHGLAFSVNYGIKTPPSLLNMYKELHDDLGLYIPNNGFLEKWAKQGVLLLNTSLTVRDSEANSHSKIGWQTFTDNIIKKLNEREKPNSGKSKVGLLRRIKKVLVGDKILEKHPNIAFEKLKNINFDLAELCLNHHNKDVDQKMKIFQELDDK